MLLDFNHNTGLVSIETLPRTSNIWSSNFPEGIIFTCLLLTKCLHQHPPKILTFRFPFAPKQDLFACCFLGFVCALFFSLLVLYMHSLFPLFHWTQHTTRTHTRSFSCHSSHSVFTVERNFCQILHVFPLSLIFLPHLNAPIYSCRSK